MDRPTAYCQPCGTLRPLDRVRYVRVLDGVAQGVVVDAWFAVCTHSAQIVTTERQLRRVQKVA